MLVNVKIFFSTLTVKNVLTVSILTTLIIPLELARLAPNIKFTILSIKNVWIVLKIILILMGRNALIVLRIHFGTQLKNNARAAQEDKY